MKRLLGLMLLSLLLLSCAAAGVSWKAEDMNGLKGKSKEFIVQRFGEPTKRSVAENGNQIWEYRKSSESHGGLNTFSKVTTLGMVGDLYVDIMRIYIKKDFVTNVSYEENVFTTATPIDMVAQSRQSSALSATVIPAKEEVESKTEVQSAETQTQTTLIIVSVSNILSEANKKSKILYRAKKGEKVVLLGSSGIWFNVKLNSGVTGWVAKGSVKEEK